MIKEEVVLHVATAAILDCEISSRWLDVRVYEDESSRKLTVSFEFPFIKKGEIITLHMDIKCDHASDSLLDPADMKREINRLLDKERGK
jgi:hypothetical protein